MSSATEPRHRPHPAPAYASASARAHPYAPGPSSHHRRRSPPPQILTEENFPPSPPRSRHDQSQSPTLKPGQDEAFENLPPPPASLKSILDSFRRSGEGDRDLLMSILGAKKAEEERMTAIIQTRLTILQARLNLATIQAQMQAMPPPDALRPERTPSLTHSNSSHESSPAYYDHVHLPRPMGYPRDPRDVRDVRDHRDPRDPREMALDEREMMEYAKERELRELREMREARERELRDFPGPSPAEKLRARADSASRPQQGLEMLLEGVREAERKDSL